MTTMVTDLVLQKESHGEGRDRRVRCRVAIVETGDVP